MRQRLAKLKIESVLTVLLALVLLAYLALYAWVDFRGFARLATPDMYEDTLAARLMWEEGTLFPTRFLFGNQFYVIATPALAAVFYGLTGSMNTAMALATTCMSALLLWSLDWMLRPFARKPLVRAAALLAAVGLIFGPASIRREDGPQLFYVMCSFYACYTITNFFILGDYARARTDARLRLPALLTASLLCLEWGRGLYRLYRRQPLVSDETRAPLLRCAVYTLANLLGLYLSRYLPAQKHTIYTGASVFSGASVSDKLRDIREAVAAVIGYDYVQRGEGHYFFLIVFLFSLLLVLGAAGLLLFRRKEGEEAAACFWWLSLITCLVVIAASFFTDLSLRATYFFPLCCLPALSLVLIARRSSPGVFAVLAAALLVLAAVNLSHSYRDDLAVVASPEETDAEQACRWTLENGYELVYGNQSSGAPIIAVCSDGRLIAGCWQSEIPFRVSPYVNISGIYHLDDNDRAVYVLHENELWDDLRETSANGASYTFCAQFGPYYLFTSSKQLLYPISETAEWNPRYPEYHLKQAETPAVQ